MRLIRHYVTLARLWTARILMRWSRRLAETSVRLLLD